MDSDRDDRDEDDDLFDADGFYVFDPDAPGAEHEPDLDGDADEAELHALIESQARDEGEVGAVAGGAARGRARPTAASARAARELDGSAPVDGGEPIRDEAARALEATRYPIDALVAAVQAGQRRVVVRGLRGAMLGVVLSELRRRLDRPLLVIGPDDDALETLCEDLALFSPLQEDAALLVPPVDVSPYAGLSPNRIQVAERLAALFRLLAGEIAEYVLVSADALVRRAPPPAILEALSQVVTVGDELDLPGFKRRLVDCGYAPVQIVEDPGTFAIRGGLIDLFSPALDHPVRIELFGDEIESLRTFDPATQKGLGAINAFFVCPVREEIFTDETLSTARSRLRELADRLAFPSRSLRNVLADLEHGLHFLGIEALMPAFYTEVAAVTDYLPAELVTVVLEPEDVWRRASELYEHGAEQRARRVEHGELTFEHDQLFVAPQVLEAWVGTRPHIAANPLLTDTTDAEPIVFASIDNQDLVRMRTERGAGEGAVKGLVARLAQWREVYGEIAFAARRGGNAERLASLLRGYGQKTELVEPPLDLATRRLPPADGALRIYQGSLSAGARVPALGLALVSEAEIFGPRVHRRTTTAQAVTRSTVESFRELKPGDYLVHTEHGIGRYEGLAKLDIGGHGGDFLVVVYAGEDKLYVPVHRLASVQKYSGDQPKRVDKLGSTAWEKTKARVKEHIKAMAIDLLRLYAERQSRPGFAFPPPDEYYKEFEATFPFDETPDQARAIEEVLDDMSRARPMDRLICGDVGFGKTEVAIRGAFNAICAGRQVAVLVPTTILAEQHLNTFRTRFSGYPVRVESLNRFRSAQESKDILRDMAAGRIDVVVGTHRLLSKDIKWRNLALLIVDEEHRFGVAHKEKIKQLATQIDVLTMTATPIPRTLQMSLLGLRDMSLIATPPQDRLAVRTHVAKFDREVVRDAIMAELQRGGQVYFLHNRVQTIEQMASRIREWVPEARIGIGHGQMDERKLERVMLDFIRGELNVLVCTTIIESGLDIPNANTLLVNRADALGLAQLYQIRGRVGRSSQRAHCFLLIPGDAAITEDARERLDALQRFTDLGSGFEIAQFDLELRGAGNLLGAEQSGNVAAVGLDLYTELLEEAIHELKGEYYAPHIEPEVNLPLEALLPDDYIPDVQLRLLFYKQLSSALDTDELYRVYDELRDRFGEPPREVQNLREVIEVKLLVRRMQAAGVDVNNTAVILNIGEHSLLDPSRVVALVARETRRYQLRADMRLVRYLTKKEAAELVEFTKRYLWELAEECLLDARA